MTFIPTAKPRLCLIQNQKIQTLKRLAFQNHFRRSLRRLIYSTVPMAIAHPTEPPPLPRNFPHRAELAPVWQCKSKASEIHRSASPKTAEGNSHPMKWEISAPNHSSRYPHFNQLSLMQPKNDKIQTTQQADRLLITLLMN